ncbi:hypothetical protein J437_LFUL013986 [Ladona fulva]|uniref:Uncharacterized protein n=1 Tax=Ladona fulva TaxID=123851 RepID=A0A8K0P697_LADFU|nr:hypothetical protein J437_LFUL013986 [Ladona fulva]
MVPTVELCSVVPGFNLTWREWCSHSRIRSDQSRCAYSLHKWGFKDTPTYDYGSEAQTTTHICRECQLTSFSGSLKDSHNLTPLAAQWLQNLKINL